MLEWCSSMSCHHATRENCTKHAPKSSVRCCSTVSSVNTELLGPHTTVYITNNLIRTSTWTINRHPSGCFGEDAPLQHLRAIRSSALVFARRNIILKGQFTSVTRKLVGGSSNSKTYRIYKQKQYETDHWHRCPGFFVVVLFNG